MNFGGEVQLVIVNIFRNLPIPFISKDLDDSLAWNWMVSEYIVVVFDFVENFLASNGAVLLFHPNDFKILKEVKFYLESYGF
jgi:hypothetical protein